MPSRERDPCTEIGTEKGNKRKLILKYLDCCVCRLLGTSLEESGASHYPGRKTTALLLVTSVVVVGVLPCEHDKNKIQTELYRSDPAPQKPGRNNVSVYYLYNHQFILILKYRTNFASLCRQDRPHSRA